MSGKKNFATFVMPFCFRPQKSYTKMSIPTTNDIIAVNKTVVHTCP